ncbi:MAG: peroxiredoxin [Candidatus Caldarchaeum sp.]|uniref:thioredoxin-dependent peroxiredoxin n=1 Tax=Caldiarchaeum subterraneum TaxID=311458 RepID=A0A7C5LCY9_CALS0
MVKAGDIAPDFTLPSSNGGVIQLSSLRGRRVVLFFYPKDGSPGCTRENCLLRDMLPEFEKRGAVVLGISRDSLESHKRFAEKHQLTHLLLSDRDGSVCRKYDALGLFGMVKRKTFVVDEKGVILYVVEGMMPDKHVRESLQVLDKMTAAGA